MTLVEHGLQSGHSFAKNRLNKLYNPKPYKSEEATGILKQMGDTLSATLKDVTTTEEAAKKTFDELMKANTLTKDLKAKPASKTVRVLPMKKCKEMVN